MLYPYKKIEKCVQKFWSKNKTFKTKNNINKKKYYCLCMFPYPSGKIHIGHVRNYTIGDIIARHQRMIGKNVLFPIGWDSFGLPAENASIEKKIDPKIWTNNNILYMKEQIKSIGFSFDWDKELNTCLPEYYKYEQFLFKKLYKKKIIYKKKGEINWCNNDKTVLANEQIINNKCWRCNEKTIKKNKEQWFLKIKDFANPLLKNIDKLTNWPINVKTMQKNWIGKIEWNEILFYFILKKNKIKYKNNKIIIYSETNNISNIKKIIIHKSNIFLKEIILKTKYNINKILNNLYIYNPITKKKIDIKIFNSKQIYKHIIIKNNTKIINNYIKKNNIYGIKKINFLSYYSFINCSNDNINNNKYIYNILIKKNFIFKKELFNLNNWCISRQRYWGSPIPILYNKNNNKKYLINNNLIPIINNDYKKYYKYKNIYFNKKKNIIIEKDTLDTFIQSSWYYLKFTYKNKKNIFKNNKITNYWLPIDSYIGGIEHATMHLLYIRYFNKLFKKLNFINNNEPINELICQGMITYKSYYYIKNNKKIWISEHKIKKNNNNIIYNGICKMSKSKKNGIDPSYIIKKYGADTLRMFIIFLAPINTDIEWDEKKILGVYRFLNKIWDLFYIISHEINIFYKKKIKKKYYINDEEIKLYNFFNNNLLLINNLIDKKKYNIVISITMNILNKIFNVIKNKNFNIFFIKHLYIKFIKIIYIFSPHITFVIWKKIFKNKSIIDNAKWPIVDNIFFSKNLNIITDNIIFNIFINSKKINYIKIMKNLEKNKILEIIFKNKNIMKNINIDINKIKKIIFVKNRLINFLIYE